MDISVKRVEEMESYQGPGVPKGQFVYAGKALGVTGWAMNLLNLPPNWQDYPDHDHVKNGQEEVYVVLKGSASLQAGGSTWRLEPGVIARVGPAQKRKILPGNEGVTILALGGKPAGRD